MSLPPSPVGFQTASGHQVSVSEEAMARAKRAWEQAEKEAAQEEEGGEPAGKRLRVSQVKERKREKKNEERRGSPSPLPAS